MARSRNKKTEIEEEIEKRIPTTRYNPDYKVGLTAQKVQEHRLHGWVNRAVDPPSKTTKEIVHENVFTYFNLIFLVLAILLCLVGSFRDLTFLPVIIANTLSVLYRKCAPALNMTISSTTNSSASINDLLPSRTTVAFGAFSMAG